MPLAASLIAALVGAGATAYGSSKAAKAANKAGSDARALYDDQTSAGMNRLGSLLMGGGNWQDLLYGAGTRPSTPRPTAPDRASFGGYSSGGGADAGGRSMPFNQAGFDAAMRKYETDLAAWERSQASAAKGQAGALGSAVNAMGGPILDQVRQLGAGLGRDQGAINRGYEQLAGAMQRRGAATAGGLDRGYANLSGGLQSLLRGGAADVLGGFQQATGRELDRFGKGREAQIRDDYGRAEKSQQAASIASLNARGFGNSTAVANQASQISQGIGRERSRALTDLGDQRARLGLGVASERAGLASQQYGRLADAMSAMGLSRLGAAERMSQANQGRLSSIQGAGLAARERGIDRSYGAGLNAPNTLLGILGGNVMNPYLGMSTTQYFPGASPIGAAAGQLGGGLAALGSFGLGSAMTDRQIEEYLKRMKGG